MQHFPIYVSRRNKRIVLPSGGDAAIAVAQAGVACQVIPCVSTGLHTAATLQEHNKEQAI